MSKQFKDFKELVDHMSKEELIRQLYIATKTQDSTEQQPLQMNTEKFGVLMYAMTKKAASESFQNWLDWNGVSWDEYMDIKFYLQEKYGVKTYV